MPLPHQHRAPPKIQPAPTPAASINPTSAVGATAEQNPATIVKVGRHTGPREKSAVMNPPSHPGSMGTETTTREVVPQANATRRVPTVTRTGISGGNRGFGRGYVCAL